MIWTALYVAWAGLKISLGLWVMLKVFQMQGRITRLEDPPVPCPRPTDQLESRVRDSMLFLIRDGDPDPIKRAIARELLDRRLAMAQIRISTNIGQVKIILDNMRAHRKGR
jgi:hypothetical protein